MTYSIQSPEDIDTLFTTAAKYQQNGQLAEAIQIYNKLIQVLPNISILHYNIAHAYYDLNNKEQALTHYLSAFDLDPNDPDILFNLALCCKACNLFDKAIEKYKELLIKEPANIDVLYNLGNCYKDNFDINNAITTYHTILEIDENHRSTINNLAYSYHKIDDDKNATLFYNKLLELDPDNIPVKYLISALSGDLVTSAPAEYVKSVFDNYSDSYEHSLVNELSYSVPIQLRETYNSTFPNKQSIQNCLDLGCGSGLAAAEFVDICCNFTGVDLSEKMLELAASKDIYKSLFAEDIETFISQNQEKFDLILAADVFIYIGELENIFRKLTTCATDSCVFAFSTELLKGSGNYILQKSGRFAYSTEYITKTTLNTGWEVVSSRETSLRKERGQWKDGIIFFLTPKK